jgi:hypothetical protein
MHRTLPTSVSSHYSQSCASLYSLLAYHYSVQPCCVPDHETHGPNSQPYIKWIFHGARILWSCDASSYNSLCTIITSLQIMSMVRLDFECPCSSWSDRITITRSMLSILQTIMLVIRVSRSSGMWCRVIFIGGTCRRWSRDSALRLCILDGAVQGVNDTM